MSNTLRMDDSGHVFINDIEIPCATVLNVSVKPNEVMTVSIECFVTSVDIPGYPPISMQGLKKGR